jgi:hypothetical protein
LWGLTRRSHNLASRRFNARREPEHAGWCSGVASDAGLSSENHKSSCREETA